MSAFPTGVTIVTTLDENGRGVRPDLQRVHVGLRRAAPGGRVRGQDRATRFRRCATRASFVVNFLSAGREELATLCASKRSDKFMAINWRASDHHEPADPARGLGRARLLRRRQRDRGRRPRPAARPRPGSAPPGPGVGAAALFQAHIRHVAGAIMSSVVQAADSRFATVEEAVEDIRAGRFVVVVDDEDRENEGDLTIAAQFATPEAINFMASYGRGLICLCLTEERCDELELVSDGQPQRVALRHRLHLFDRGPRRRDDRHLGARSLAHDPGRDRPDQGRARHRPSRARLPACVRGRAACCNARGRRRRRSISPGSPGSFRRASSAR